MSSQQMYLQQSIDIYLASKTGLLSPRVLQLYEWSGRLLVDFLDNLLIDHITVLNLRLWRGHLSEMNSRHDGHFPPTGAPENARHFRPTA